MKKATCSVVLFASILTASLGGLWYTQRTTANAEPLRTRKVLHYIDPMHPAYKSPEPGIAPDCGMQLEPVYADGASWERAATSSHRHHATVNLSAEQQRLIGVRVAAVQRSSGARSVRVFGRIAAEENRLYKVNVGVGGYIRDVSAATTGSQVQKNEWLATFSSPELRQPIQAYLVSLDIVDRAERNSEPLTQANIAKAGLNQNVDRLLTMGMSPRQLEEIRQHRVVPPNVAIRAPGAGFILARNVTPGQAIEADTELYQIADLKKVWIYADAFGLEAQALRHVVAADVKIPGQVTAIRARVTEVLPVFDATTQSLKVRLEADNPDYLLRPDMLVDVELQVPSAPAMTVPREAVVQTGLEAIVFVERGDGQFEPRRVETGWRSGDRIEITRGLEPGERVAASGTFLLDSDRRMRLTAVEPGADR